MAGVVIKVSPDDLRRVANEIKGYAGEYQDAYKAMYTDADEMQANYTGIDSTAYVNQIKGFNDDLAKMYELMMDYAAYLEKAADTYEQTQQAIAQNAAKLQN